MRKLIVVAASVCLVGLVTACGTPQPQWHSDEVLSRAASFETLRSQDTFVQWRNKLNRNFDKAALASAFPSTDTLGIVMSRDNFATTEFDLNGFGVTNGSYLFITNVDIIAALTATNAVAALHSIQFPLLAVAPSYSEGLLFYDPDTGYLTLYNFVSTMTHQIGGEVTVPLRNNTGSTIFDFTPVYQTGGVGSRATIAVASGTNVNMARTLSIMTHDILNNENGFGTVRGSINGVDTDGSPFGEVWIENQEIFLGTNDTDHYMTTNPPAWPFECVSLGSVLNAANNGSFQTKIEHGQPVFRASIPDFSGLSLHGLLNMNTSAVQNIDAMRFVASDGITVVYTNHQFHVNDGLFDGISWDVGLGLIYGAHTGHIAISMPAGKLYDTNNQDAVTWINRTLHGNWSVTGNFDVASNITAAVIAGAHVGDGSALTNLLMVESEVFKYETTNAAVFVDLTGWVTLVGWQWDAEHMSAMQTDGTGITFQLPGHYDLDLKLSALEADFNGKEVEFGVWKNDSLQTNITGLRYFSTGSQIGMGSLGGKIVGVSNDYITVRAKLNTGPASGSITPRRANWRISREHE